ncbi:MAG: metallophosphoesterase, partial [Rhodospirillales bacterium]|nr:metallophosphoesterase [Rhodospirillales bacterium]
MTRIADQPAATRRGILECMLWAGSGVLWTVAGGVPRSSLIGDPAAAATTGLSFAQISDSHIGFHAPANPDVTATLQQAADQVKALGARASMLIHTGDVSHLARAAQFDTARQIIAAIGRDTHFVPGEHDVLGDGGRGFFARFGRPGAPPGGWYSFDQQGVHFIGLNNVSDLRPGGLGRLGAEQMAWLRTDLAARPASQPIVVMAHIPLWAVYPAWGWGTDEAADILAALRRFGSVTVLNGHIHQVLQKVEGHVSFHTALSTAFPQPAPGTAAHPGPMTLPAGQLGHALGTARVTYVPGNTRLAVIQS